MGGLVNEYERAGDGSQLNHDVAIEDRDKAMEPYKSNKDLI